MQSELKNHNKMHTYIWGYSTLYEQIPSQTVKKF